MATQDGWTVDTSLDGDQWSGGPAADASGLWQSGHRTNDWTAEWQSAVRLASGRARLRNQLPRVKSTPRYSRSAGLLEICIHVPVWSGIWSEVDINHRAGFMSTRLSSSPAHLPLANASAQYRIAKL